MAATLVNDLYPMAAETGNAGPVTPAAARPGLACTNDREELP